MNFFKERIHFSQIDPLGDGLREEIAAEQQEAQAIILEEGIDQETLAAYWQSIEAESSDQFVVSAKD